MEDGQSPRTPTARSDKGDDEDYGDEGEDLEYVDDYEVYEAPVYWRIPYRVCFWLAEITGLVYFGWRFGWTLNPGYWEFWYSLVLVASEFYFFLTTTLFFLNMYSPRANQISLLNELEPEFPMEEWPSVDVLIPCCREPVEVIKNTMLHSLAMNYPPDKLHVYVCDDGKDAKAEQMVREAFSLNSNAAEAVKTAREVVKNADYLPKSHTNLVPVAALKQGYVTARTARTQRPGADGGATARTQRQGLFTNRNYERGDVTNRATIRTTRDKYTARTGRTTRREGGGNTSRGGELPLGAPSLVYRTRAALPLTARDAPTTMRSGNTARSARTNRTNREGAPTFRTNREGGGTARTQRTNRADATGDDFTTQRLMDMRIGTVRATTQRLQEERTNRLGTTRTARLTARGATTQRTTRLADNQKTKRADDSENENSESHSSEEKENQLPKLALDKPKIAPVMAHGRAKKRTIAIMTTRENTEYPMDAVGLPEELDFDDPPSLSYVARYKPPNLPHHAKAGNLNNTIYNADSSGDLLLVLDCDMAPEPDLLLKLVPYFFYYSEDENQYKWVEDLSFVQSPQHFINIPYSDPFAHRNSLFYGPVLEGRDGWGSTPFIGTNCLFSRRAILDIGGFIYGSVTEDVYTSMKLHSRGYTSVYHNEFLAHGLAPEDLPSTVKQRLRWAKGSLQILFRDFPLTHNGLSLIQRLFYLEAAIYPFNGVFIILFSLCPAVFFFSGVSPTLIPTDLVWMLPTFFLPYFCMNRLTLYVAATGINKDDIVRDGQLAWMLAPVWCLGIAEVMSGKKIDFTVTPKDGELQRWSWLVFPALVVFVINLAGIIFACIMFPTGFFGQVWVFYASLGFSLSVMFLYYNTIYFSLFLPPPPDDEETIVKKEFHFPWLFVCYTAAIIVFIATVSVWQIEKFGATDE